MHTLLLLCSFAGLDEGRGFLTSNTRNLAYGIPYRYMCTETIGSPEFPGYPFENMPWSKTPVVSLNSCHIEFRTAAFRLLKNVGFFLHCRIITMTTTIHFSGLNTEPAILIRPASDSRLQVYLWTSLLTCWLRFGQVGLS